MMGVTTVSALLCRISGSTHLGFGDYLRDLCDDLAATCGRSGGLKLTCAAADEALPIGVAITLGLIADLLITNAFLYAFPPGGAAVSLYPSRPGRPGCSLSRTAGSPCEPVLAGARMA
jgi:two-component sensor histidine kinase